VTTIAILCKRVFGISPQALRLVQLRDLSPEGRNTATRDTGLRHSETSGGTQVEEADGGSGTGTHQMENGLTIINGVQGQVRVPEDIGPGIARLLINLSGIDSDVCPF
jgi:hypothetical protein